MEPFGMADASQIGFLTEWQMYAQKLEGDSWIGERMDAEKIDKMSGMIPEAMCLIVSSLLERSTAWSTL
jgi:hypothetical protein